MIELENGQIVKLNFNIPSKNDINITCTVKGFENDRINLIFPKERNEFLKDLPEGKEIEAIVYTNSGIFVFDSIIINSPLEHDFVIELPEEKQKIQRREYIRTPINLKLALSRDDIQYETKTINVGGGGIRFISQEKLNVNSLWRLSLLLPDGKALKGLGKILYTFLQGRNIVSVIVFTDISETERNRLIKLCFDEEIKNVKARKLSDKF